VKDNRPIIFCGREEAEQICRGWNVPRVLSISDPRTEKPKVGGTEGTLRLRFYDVEEDSSQFRSVTPQQVAQMAEFMLGAKRWPTLVHCEMGISRSAAATMIGYYLLCGSEQEAAERTRDSRDGPFRDHVRPNRLILFYADSLFDSKLDDAAVRAF
jgi:predicted protein tyrosine phosphatase